MEDSPGVSVCEKTEKPPKGVIRHSFRWLNGAPLNETHFGEKVNFLEYRETRPDGGSARWTWVTDLELSEGSVMPVMRAARSRWRIENETFQTLKKLTGYGLEHNYGHGEKHLCSVFAALSCLAFLIDQIQEFCCPLFQKALKFQKRKSYMWEAMRQHFVFFRFSDWRIFWQILSQPPPTFDAGAVLDGL